MNNLRPTEDEAAAMRAEIEGEIGTETSGFTSGSTAEVAPAQAAPVAAVAAPAADLGADGKPLPNMVPRSRVTEEADRRRDAEALVVQQAAELAQLRAAVASGVVTAAPAAPVAAPVPQERDFDAEQNELAQKYDDGDLTHAEYLAAQRQLTKDEIRYTSAQAAQQAIASERNREAVAAVEQDWNTARDQFLLDNKDFVTQPGVYDNLQIAIKSVDEATGGKLAPSDLLARAHIIAANLSGLPAPTAAATPAPTARPASQRARDAAALAADASQIPPAGTGQAGNRATAGEVDVENLDRKGWKDLPAHMKDRALGIT